MYSLMIEGLRAKKKSKAQARLSPLKELCLQSHGGEGGGMVQKEVRLRVCCLEVMVRSWKGWLGCQGHLQSSVPSTRVGRLTTACNSSSRDSCVLFWPLQHPHGCDL